MFDRIVVPLDGSPQAETVFATLRNLFRRKDAEVVLVQGVLPPASVEAQNVAAIQDGLEKEAADYLERQRAHLEGEGLRVSTEVRVGWPADVILRVARESNAGLIAMSTHGRSGLARWVLGSVTEEVLRRSGIPVLAAHADRPDGRAREGRSILVPFDGSEESLSVAPLAIEMARLFEARVAVLRVEEGGAGESDLGFVGFTMTGTSSLQRGSDVLDRDLVEVGNRFAREGLHTTLFRVRGDPVAKINHLARILPAEAIVMATHGRQGVSRLLTGSVAEEVVRRGEVPVLVRKIGIGAATASH